MPISAQEWRVRTGLINACRIRTVSVSRSSKPTVSVLNPHRYSAASFPGSSPIGGEMVAWHSQPARIKGEDISCFLALTELPSSTWKGWRALLLCLIAPLVPKMITVLIMICHLFLIVGKGIYTVGGEAEGYIVSKIMSPFDSHPFLWIALLAAVLILSFIVLRLMFKSQHRKANACLLIHIIISSSAEGPLCRTTTHVLCSNVNIVAMLLLLSGDVETNPGPGQLVTLKNARSALYPVRAKWRDIGIELEIDIGTLDSIERSCHFQDNDCLTRMLDYWLKQTDPPPSWDAILEALESGPVHC